MAETLFTDIIDNLGKTVKKIKGDKPGKFFIDPVFNPDGSRKIVGGYGSEDRAAFIEKDKSGIKGTIQYGNDDTNKKFRLTSDGKNTQGEIVFKFADGGSTNGSAEKAFSAKVNELMDDGYEFGEAVKEAMRQGYKNGDKVTPISQINAPQRAYQSLINLGIEAKVKELFQSGFGAGNITKKLKLLYKGQPNIANKINSTLIGNYLTYAKRNLGLVKPGLNVAIQNQYGPMRSLTEVQKAIDEAPKIKKGNKYFDMNARDLEGRSVWNHTDSDKSRTGKKGKQYVSRTEIETYKDKLKIKGSGKEVLIDNSKTKANQERYKKDKLAKLNAGPETVALNKELSTKYVTKENNKLRQDFKYNPSETISKIRNNKNIMFQT